MLIPALRAFERVNAEKGRRYMMTGSNKYGLLTAALKDKQPEMVIACARQILEDPETLAASDRKEPTSLINLLIRLAARAIVNGENVNPLGEAGVHAGEQNGETLAWIQYDLSEMAVGDELRVDLPIRGKESIDNKELSFTMPVKDLPGVRRIRAIPDLRFSDYSLRLAEMLISPIRVYVRVEMTADAGVTAERCDDIMWTWAIDGALMDEGDDKPYTTSGGGSRYLENAEYADDFKIKLSDETKPTRFTVEFEFLTRESYPDAFVFSNGVDSLRIPNEAPVNN